MRSADPVAVANDASFAQRLRADDARALEELFHQYYAPLCRFAKAYVHSSADAEDLVQSVFIQLWDQRQRWVLRGSMRAYLYTAVRNTSLNVLKHRVVEHRTLESDDAIPRIGIAEVAPAPDEVAAAHDFEAAINRAIVKLPDRYRLVIMLRAQHQLTIPEIARILDLPVKTTETRAARAVQALRAALQPFLK